MLLKNYPISLVNGPQKLPLMYSNPVNAVAIVVSDEVLSCVVLIK